MSDAILVSTRKGLFTVNRDSSGWKVTDSAFLGDNVTLALGQGFHRRRLTIRSSQVGSVATDQRSRWDHRRRMALALSLLADPVLDLLITGEDAFDDLPEVQARLARDPGDTLMHRIRYE